MGPPTQMFAVKNLIKPKMTDMTADESPVKQTELADLKLTPQKTSVHAPDEVVEAIKEKVKDFNPEDVKKELAKSKWQGEAMGFLEMARKTGSCGTSCQFYVAMVISLFHGAALPAIFLLFRFMIDSFGQSAASSDNIQRNEDAFFLAAEQGMSRDELLTLANEQIGDANPLEETKKIALF